MFRLKNVISLVSFVIILLSYCSTLKAQNLRQQEVKNTNLIEGPTTVQRFTISGKDEHDWTNSSPSAGPKQDMSKKQKCVRQIIKTNYKNNQRLCTAEELALGLDK